MDIGSLVGTLLSSDSVKGVSARTETKESSVQSVLGAALPLLLQGANTQSKGEDTAAGFSEALEQHAKSDTSNLTSFLGNVDIEDGAKIVAHLLGSNSKSTTKAIAKETGESQDNVAQILSSIAPLVLSLLGKQTAKETKKGAGSANTELVGTLMGTLLNNVDMTSLMTGLLGAGSASAAKEEEEEEEEEEKPAKKTTTKKTTAAKSSTAKKTTSTKSSTAKKTTSTKSSTAKSSTTKSSTAKKTTAAKSSTAKKTTTKAAEPEESKESGIGLGDVASILTSLLK